MREREREGERKRGGREMRGRGRGRESERRERGRKGEREGGRACYSPTCNFYVLTYVHVHVRTSGGKMVCGTEWTVEVDSGERRRQNIPSWRLVSSSLRIT